MSSHNEIPAGISTGDKLFSGFGLQLKELR
jgi:hypothetical protein